MPLFAKLLGGRSRLGYGLFFAWKNTQGPQTSSRERRYEIHYGGMKVKKTIRTLVAAAIAVTMVLSAAAPALAYNGITAGTAYQPPILRNWSQTGWTPFGADNTNAQNIDGQGWEPLRFYPKPDGGTLPAMGWNSWNAFASNITEARIRGIADQFISMGLDKLGYKYVVIDDGCYQGTSRPLANHPTNFPSGFKVLSDYVHGLGLKYGMYQDSGPRTCGGQMGAYGYEDEIGAQLVGWGVDYLKYDFCGNPFGMQSNYWVGGGPNVRSIQFTGNGYDQTISWAAAPAGVTYIGSANRNTNGYLASLGITAYGSLTNPTFVQGAATMSITNVPEDGEYTLTMSTGAASATAGRYLVVEINGERQFERLMPNTGGATTWQNTTTTVKLKAGTNSIRLCCPKNQEIGLYCYGAIRDGMNKAGGEDIILSMCDWGYFGAHTYGWQIGESARTSEDIANVAGQGNYSWTQLQYNRVAYGANRFNKLGGSWMDPDMMVVGLRANASTNFTWQENMQHFAAWCILNAPLMLGCDLTDAAIRSRVMTGDGSTARTGIINNRDLIWFNQDPLGVSGKVIKNSGNNPNSYVTGSRLDCIVKPLSDGDIGVYFGNWGNAATTSLTMTLNINEIIAGIGDQMINKDAFAAAGTWYAKDIYTTAGTVTTLTSATQNISVTVAGHDSRCFRISTKPFADRGFYAGVGLSFDQMEFKYKPMPKSATEWFNNRANAIGVVSNSSAADIRARIKIEILNRKGILVDSKLGDIMTIEPGSLVPWELKYEITGPVNGFTVTATLLDAATGLALAPSYSVTNDEVGSTGVKLDPAAFAGNGIVTATATLYNDEPGDVSAAVKFELYNAAGTLADTKYGDAYEDIGEDETAVWHSTYAVPAKVYGYTLKAYLVDPETDEPLSGAATATGPAIPATSIALSPASFAGGGTVSAAATYYNAGAADIGATVKFELIDAKGETVDTKAAEPAKAIESEDAATWSATYTVPAKAFGYTLKATLVNAATGEALSGAATASGPAINPTGITLATAATAATATAWVYNDSGSDVKAHILVACYGADGSIQDIVAGAEVTVETMDNVSFSLPYGLPSGLGGRTIRAFLLSDANVKMAPPAAAGTAAPSASANVVSEYGVLAKGIEAKGLALYENGTGAAANAVVLVARYNAKGIMVDLKLSDPAPAPAGGVAVLTLPYALPEDSSGQTVKAFLWDADTFVPLAGDSSQAVLDYIPADKTALSALIQSASQLSANYFTEETFAVLTAALGAANIVYANERATQSEVDAAASALQAAINGLESLIDLNRAAVYTFAEGNLARHADVVQTITSSSTAANTNRTYNANGTTVGITASYVASGNGSNNIFAVMNNGVLSTTSGASDLNARSWNTYGSNSGPHYVVLRWNSAFTISASRVMWWYDGTASSSGVTLPAAGTGTITETSTNRTTVQYWNTANARWENVTNMRNAAGASVETIGVAGGGTNAANRTWNGVTFDPVVTDRVRLVIQKGIGNGMGVGQWEVFGR